MSHFIRKCKKCGDVIAQCRCPEGANNIEYGICDKCSQQGQEVPIKEYLDRINPLNEDMVKQLEVMALTKESALVQIIAWLKGKGLWEECNRELGIIVRAPESK